jgi:hypothetical protein
VVRPDGILSGAIPVWPTVPAGGEGREPQRPTPAQTIVYRTCPECRQSTLDTAEGPIAIAPGRVTELEPVANRVTIADGDEAPPELMPPGEVDRPNSQALARKVLQRDGLRCANPACGNRRNLHAHHIVFRSRGGRTVLTNEVAVCDVCHALLHKGLLEVTGSPDGKLEWRPRPLDTNVKLREAAGVRARLAELEPEIAAAAARRAELGGSQLGGSEAAGAMSAGADTRYPSAGADTRSPSAGPDTGYPSAGADTPHPSAGADTRYPSAGADTRYPSAGADTRYPSAGADTRHPSAGADTRRRSAADPYDPARIRDLAEGLKRLGCTLAEGERRVRDAITALLAQQRTSPGASGAYVPLDEADILRKAIRG